MKKKWLLLLLVLSPFLCWSGCYVWQNTKSLGPDGEILCTVFFPLENGSAEVFREMAGYVQVVRFVPQQPGLKVEVKTTSGWYFLWVEEPIDPNRTVSVHFLYPKDMVLREETSSFITMRHTFLGLEDRAGYGGCPPLPGDIVTIRWSHKLTEKADKSGHYPTNEVLVERVDHEGKPWVHGSSWGHHPSEIIEVLIFDHKVDAL